MLEAKTIQKDGKKFLVVEIPMSDGRDSASGKTKVFASTRGNQPTAVEIEGQKLIVGLNAYIHKG